MPNRIDIELTSSQPDGSWTWRAASAREPRGVLDGSLLPSGASVGDQLKVETEHDLDGITVLSVVPSKAKDERPDVLELLPSDKPFQPVVEHRARRERGEPGPRRERADRPGRGDRRGGPGGNDRRDRRDAPGGPASPGAPGTDRGDRRSGPGGNDRRDRRDAPSGPGSPGAPGTDRGDRRDRRDGPGSDRADRRDGRPRRTFTPPPEIEQRPKPKRLRAGSKHREEVLASLPEEQRPIAELATQGMPAVRQRISEENARLREQGKPEMPQGTVLKMAEDLLPRLRVAEWLDRAEAARSQLAQLDLRDLRSVVAAGEDPAVARDNTTSELAAALKVDLAHKLEQETELWLGDIESAVKVGRVIRALRLSSQPPKAGVPFPPALSQQLGDAANEALQPADPADRWSAVLEAVAFSPIRSHVNPTRAPQPVTDELTATVTRLAPLLPQVAALFGISVAPNAPAPRPLRTPPRKPSGAKGRGGDGSVRPDRERTEGRRRQARGQARPGGANRGSGASAPPPESAEPAATAATQAADAPETTTTPVAQPTDAAGTTPEPTDTTTTPVAQPTDAVGTTPEPTDTTTTPVAQPTDAAGTTPEPTDTTPEPTDTRPEPTDTTPERTETETQSTTETTVVPGRSNEPTPEPTVAHQGEPTQRLAVAEPSAAASAPDDSAA